MILSDWDLEYSFDTFIQLKDPYGNSIKCPNRELINPASIDIRLGRYMLRELQHLDQGGLMMRYDISDSTPNNPFLLEPKEFVLLESMEWITCPNGFAMEFMLKSSTAREGLEHHKAGHIDPGFSGILTLEVVNAKRFTRVPIWYGMRFGQITVAKTLHKSSKPYDKTGRYINPLTVEDSKRFLSD